mgnify:CR=1 FL=1|jgi:hypothetical protein
MRCGLRAQAARVECSAGAGCRAAQVFASERDLGDDHVAIDGVVYSLNGCALRPGSASRAGSASRREETGDGGEVVHKCERGSGERSGRARGWCSLGASGPSPRRSCSPTSADASPRAALTGTGCRSWNHPGGDQIKLFGGNDVSVQYRMIHPFHAGNAGILNKMPRVGRLAEYRQDYSFGARPTSARAVCGLAWHPLPSTFD